MEGRVRLASLRSLSDQRHDRKEQPDDTGQDDRGDTGAQAIGVFVPRGILGAQAQAHQGAMREDGAQVLQHGPRAGRQPCEGAQGHGLRHRAVQGCRHRHRRLQPRLLHELGLRRPRRGVRGERQVPGASGQRADPAQLHPPPREDRRHRAGPGQAPQVRCHGHPASRREGPGRLRPV